MTVTDKGRAYTLRHTALEHMRQARAAAQEFDYARAEDHLAKAQRAISELSRTGATSSPVAP